MKEEKEMDPPFPPWHQEAAEGSNCGGMAEDAGLPAAGAGRLPLRLAVIAQGAEFSASLADK